MTRHPKVKTKRCARCGRELSVLLFAPAERMRDGLSSWCRGCANEATRRWRAANPEHAIRANAARRVHHPPRECVGCGVTFTPARVDSRHCCQACRDDHRAVGFRPLIEATRRAHIAKHHPRGA